MNRLLSLAGWLIIVSVVCLIGELLELLTGWTPLALSWWDMLSVRALWLASLCILAAMVLVLRSGGGND